MNKIITLGDIFKNLETEKKAFEFREYIVNLQIENERLNNIINELEKELNIAYKELQPNEMVRGQDLIKNIQITIQELKGVVKE